MGTPHDPGAEQPEPIIGPEHGHMNGYLPPSSPADRAYSKMHGMEVNPQQQYHLGSRLDVFQQTQPYIGAPLDRIPVGGHQSNGIHVPVIPEQPVLPRIPEHPQFSPHALFSTNAVTATSVQSVNPCSSAPDKGFHHSALGSSMHSAPVYPQAPDGFLQQNPGIASRLGNVAHQTHCTMATEHCTPTQSANRAMQSLAHSGAGAYAPVQLPSLPVQASTAAEKPARSKSISIRIKAFKGSHSELAANHIAPVMATDTKVVSAAPSATNCTGTELDVHDPKPIPSAKRKSRGSGTSQGKKRKAQAVTDYLRQAEQLVKGSCARVVLMGACARNNTTSHIQKVPAGEKSDDDEEESDTLSTLARSHNIQCHLDAVARGGIVAQVSDPQTIEADRWRRKCKSTSRFDEVQATTAQRTSGRSRKSTKPQMQRGKEAAAQQHRFVVRPSHIAGIGVFTKEDIPAKQILLEYQGVTVRRVHADRLEASYEKAGEDHYLFAVDQSEFIVDATKRGGMARFVNHSCGPNCEVRTVSAEGIRRVVLVSLREIRRGEELCYDYRLNPDPDKAIRCKCRSKRCRGWL